jgi:hypothetical protein
MTVALVTPIWRGISQCVLDEAGVYSMNGVVHIPYRDLDGSLLRTRLISADGFRWWSDDGKGVHLLGLETLTDNPTGPLFVTEGESDALAAREHLGVTALGCPGASCWKPGWRWHLLRHEPVYAIGDGDAAGQRFVSVVTESAFWVCPVVCPEGTDLRGLFQGGRQLLIEELMFEARQRRELAELPRRMSRPKPKPLPEQVDTGPAMYETQLALCDTCGDERPFAWTGQAWNCVACEVAG